MMLFERKFLVLGCVIALHGLLACGTQVGNPDDEEVPDARQTSAPENNRSPDGTSSELPPATGGSTVPPKGEPGAQSSLPLCSSTQVDQGDLVGGKVEIQFANLGTKVATVKFVSSGGSIVEGSSLSPLSVDTYTTTVSYDGTATCVLRLQITDANVGRYLVVTVDVASVSTVTF